MPERRADGEEESRPMRATRTEESSEKIFQNPLAPPPLSYPKPTFAPSPLHAFISLPMLFFLPFFFSPPNFSIPFHLFTLPSLLLSISICTIGRAIPVSLFTDGFRTHPSRHLRTSHAASSDHPFNEKTLSSSLNELSVTSARIARQSLRRFIRHFEHCISAFIVCFIRLKINEIRRA